VTPEDSLALTEADLSARSPDWVDGYRAGTARALLALTPVLRHPAADWPVEFRTIVEVAVADLDATLRAAAANGWLTACAPVDAPEWRSSGCLEVTFSTPCRCPECRRS
jgi:hypothetical protein